ncbi:hypothetical protein ILYODFUR_031545, partial [Ilyodon furcidens]
MNRNRTETDRLRGGCVEQGINANTNSFPYSVFFFYTNPDQEKYLNCIFKQALPAQKPCLSTQEQSGNTIGVKTLKMGYEKKKASMKIGCSHTVSVQYGR